MRILDIAVLPSQKRKTTFLRSKNHIPKQCTKQLYHTTIIFIWTNCDKFNVSAAFRVCKPCSFVQYVHSPMCLPVSSGFVPSCSLQYMIREQWFIAKYAFWARQQKAYKINLMLINIRHIDRRNVPVILQLACNKKGRLVMKHIIIKMIFYKFY